MRKESLIAAYSTGNQTQSILTERPYDRQRAAAYSPGLGIAAKRLKAAGDPQPGDWNNVILTLHKALWQGYKRSHSLSHQNRAKLCRIAIMEWYHWQCATCRGAGECINDDGLLLATCPHCRGTTLRCYSDGERATLYGERLDKLAEDVLTAARNFLVDHENVTDYNASAALERAIPEEYVHP